MTRLNKWDFPFAFCTLATATENVKLFYLSKHFSSSSPPKNQVKWYESVWSFPSSLFFFFFCYHHKIDFLLANLSNSFRLQSVFLLAMAENVYPSIIIIVLVIFPSFHRLWKNNLNRCWNKIFEKDSVLKKVIKRLGSTSTSHLSDAQYFYQEFKIAKP